MTINFAHFCQFFSGSGQILLQGQLYRSPGLAKIAPWCLARRDSLSAKVPGPVSADGATNAFCSYPLAVIRHISYPRTISQPIRPGQSLWTNIQQISIELCYWIDPNHLKNKFYG